MFKGQTYAGDSFYEFLRVDHPGLLPDWTRMDWTQVSLLHGTTVLAIVCKEGALMAGDRLATEGHQVGTRDLEKVFRIDESSLMAIAGAAGPAVEMVRMFQLELEHFEKLDGQPLTFEGKANRLSFLLRQNLPAAMQGLVAGQIENFVKFPPRSITTRVAAASTSSTSPADASARPTTTPPDRAARTPGAR